MQYFIAVILNMLQLIVSAVGVVTHRMNYKTNGLLSFVCIMYNVKYTRLNFSL